MNGSQAARQWRFTHSWVASIAIVLALSTNVRGETGSEGWLRYAPVEASAYTSIPVHVTALGASPIERSAAIELVRGIGNMLSRSEPLTPPSSAQPAIIVGTVDE